jgi:dihydrofolate reductase
MARLIYSAIASLDGFVADRDGNFAWAAPDEEVHAFVNELERPVGTYLYGRRMYEAMAVWDTLALTDEPYVIRDFAEIWRAADKVVYSRTLDGVSTARTRLERELDADALRRVKAEADRDLSIGGPELAAQALEAGLVDELELFLTPVLVGVGKHSLPTTAELHLRFARTPAVRRRHGFSALPDQSRRLTHPSQA